jgi:hypothetical protein
MSKKRYLTFNGKTQRIYEWAKEIGIPYAMIHDRLSLGYPPDKALTPYNIKEAEKHGLKGTGAYESWSHMIQRCENPKCHEYRYYGGRGIKVHPKLRTFKDFYNLLGDRPKGLTLGRIKNDKGYEPGNVRWETWTQQARNKRNIRLLAIDGQTKTIMEWSIISGIKYCTIIMRLFRGHSHKNAVFTPLRKRRFKMSEEVQFPQC